MANNDYETAQEIKSAHAENVINLFQRSIEIMDDLFECPRFKAELHGIEQKFKDSKATYQEIDRFARGIAKASDKYNKKANLYSFEISESSDADTPDAHLTIKNTKDNTTLEMCVYIGQSNND